MEFVERNWKVIGTAFAAAAFFVSLAVSFSLRIPVFADSRAYDAIAVNLVLRHEYREISEGQLNQDRAISRIGPGYEFFLAGVYFLFGRHHEAVWIAQALFHALAALFVFLVARLIFADALWNPVISIIAASFVAFSPDLLLASSMLLAENVAIFLLTLLTWLSFRYWENKKTFFAVAAGFVFGIGILVRTPLAILFIFFALLFLMKRKWTDAVFFLLTFVLVLAPWTIRNYRTYHAFVPTSATLGDDLLAGNNPQASGELDDSRYIYNAKYKGISDIKGDRQETRDAIGFIVADPFRFVKLTAERVSIYFSFIRPTGFWPFLSKTEKIVLLFVSFLYSIFLFLFGAFGLLRALRDATLADARKKIFLYGVLVVSMPLSIMFIIVETRYRYPIYPLLAVFAGYGVWVLWRDYEKVLRNFLIVFFLLFANTLFDVARNWSRIVERLGHF